jgi:hypothetical protein
MLKFQDLMWGYSRLCHQLYVGVGVCFREFSVLSPSTHLFKLPGSCKSDDMGARGRTGQTNLCMGIPGSDKEILFWKTALENTPQMKLGS